MVVKIVQMLGLQHTQVAKSRMLPKASQDGSFIYFILFILFIHCFERVAQLASKLFYLVALYK